MSKLRPFKNFAEFKKVTGCDIGTAITVSFKYGDDKSTCLIVSFNDGAFVIGLGTKTYSYKEIFENFLFLNEKTGKFEPLGIEEKEESEIEKVKPAKFKVGHVYINKHGNAQTVIAKYRHPLNKNVYVVFTSKKEVLDMTFKVQEDENGDEICCFGNFKDGGEIVIKAKAEAEALPF